MAGLIGKSLPGVFPRCLNFESHAGRVVKKRSSDFGLMFDIDGVITRGRTLLPNSKSAFRHLTDVSGKFSVPVCFVTNAGHTTSANKAKQLSDLLEIQVEPHQVVMSHTPLKMFKRSHQRRMLISGQGPIREIAESLGFTNTTTMDEFAQRFPALDTVDHNYPKVTSNAVEENCDKIEGVILFGEPTRWESSLQLIIDALVTDGQPYDPVLTSVPYPHLPIYACNMDAVWMSEAPNPRFGHGCFLNCLESLYKKMTGFDLQYAAQVGKPDVLTYYFAEELLQLEARRLDLPTVRRMYCIGDNPAVDVYGANLFNKRVRATMLRCSALVGDKPRYAMPQKPNYNALPSAYIDSCQSILVCTGVYQGKPNQNRFKLRRKSIFDRTRFADFGCITGRELEGWQLSHVDTHVRDPSLCCPSFTTVHDVGEAVQLVLEVEGLVNPLVPMWSNDFLHMSSISTS